MSIPGNPGPGGRSRRLTVLVNDFNENDTSRFGEAGQSAEVWSWVPGPQHLYFSQALKMTMLGWEGCSDCRNLVLEARRLRLIIQKELLDLMD